MSEPAAPPRERAVDNPNAAVGSRFAGLEGYRGVAALAIVIYTVFQYVNNNNPDAFVDERAPAYLLLHGLDSLVALFFVLSAFLLALPYARAALVGSSAPSARAFLFRRATRVVPLYLVAILVVWAARNPAVPGDWVDLLQHLVFAQVFDNNRIFFTIGPAWSLAVEVHFYLLLALGGWLVTRMAWRIRPSWRLPLLLTVTLGMAAASLGWKFYAAYVLHIPGDRWNVWFSLPAKLDEFALGILLAIVVAHGRMRLNGTGVVVARALGFAVLVLAFWTRPATQTDNVFFHSIASVGFLLLLASSVLGPQDRWVKAMSARGFAFLGLVSYSLYMWHEPILILLTKAGLFPSPDAPWAFEIGVAVLTPLALAVAWVSYQVIESPAGKLRMLITRDGKPRDYYNGD